MSAHKESDARHSSASAVDPHQSAAQVSSSNREETGSEIEPPQVKTFGIDRVSLSFPVRDHQRDLSAWGTVQTFNPGTPSAAESRSTMVRASPDHDQRVFVGVKHIVDTGQWWGKVEFNPARMVDPEGHSLLDAGDLLRVVEETMDAVLTLLDPAVPCAAAMKVRRLDVARDFAGVSRPEALIRGLGPVHRPWARKNLVHFDPSKKHAQTLMVGSSSGVVRLYDKNAETGGKAAGVVRWELEARSDWCSKHGGIDTLSDAGAEQIDKLGRNRWEWSAMGNEVSGMVEIVEKVMRSGLSYAKQQRLLGILLVMAAGGEARMSKESAAGYRKTIRDLGIALEPGFAETDEPTFSVRLDLETGTEVLNVR